MEFGLISEQEHLEQDNDSTSLMSHASFVTVNDNGKDWDICFSVVITQS